MSESERDNHDWARAAALNYISDRVNESRRVETVDQMQARIRELDAKLSSAERIRLILEGDLEDAQARICELEVALVHVLGRYAEFDEDGWCHSCWQNGRHETGCEYQKAAKLIEEGK